MQIWRCKTGHVITSPKNAFYISKKEATLTDDVYWRCKRATPIDDAKWRCKSRRRPGDCCSAAQIEITHPGNNLKVSHAHNVKLLHNSSNPQDQMQHKYNIVLHN